MLPMYAASQNTWGEVHCSMQKVFVGYRVLLILVFYLVWMFVQWACIWCGIVCFTDGAGKVNI